MFLTIQYVVCEHSYQTVRMQKLIWIFAGRTCPGTNIMWSEQKNKGRKKDKRKKERKQEQKNKKKKKKKKMSADTDVVELDQAQPSGIKHWLSFLQKDFTKSPK